MRLISVNPQYCKARAVQARALADHTNEPEARDAILAVAERYETLAERVTLPGGAKLNRTYRRMTLPVRL